MLFGVIPAIITVTHLQRQNCYSQGPQAAFREGPAPEVLIQQQDGGRALFPGKEPCLRDVDVWPEDPALPPSPGGPVGSEGPGERLCPKTGSWIDGRL